MVEFYQTGFWTLSGILVTGVCMLFVFYRWITNVAEKINTRITDLEIDQTTKMAALAREQIEKLSELERDQLERINDVILTTVSKEECAAAGLDRERPMLIEIAHVKEGQAALIKQFGTLTARVSELAESVAALVVNLNGKDKAK